MEADKIFKRALLYSSLEDEEPIQFGTVNKGVYLSQNGTQIDKINKQDGCAKFEDPIKVPTGYKNGIFYFPFKIIEAESSQYTMFGVYKKAGVNGETDLNRQIFNNHGSYAVYGEGGKINNGRYEEYDCELNEYEGCIIYLKVDICNGTLSII